jgi:hypothetical protein
MDPITLAIVTAVAAGISAGVPKVAEQAMLDGYNALKSLIKQRFGSDGDLVKAVENLEAKPESEGRKTTLQEEVVEAKADQDPEILAAAEKLLSLLQAQPGGNISVQVRDGAAALGNQAKAVGKGGVMIEGDIGGDFIGPSGTKEQA